MSRLIAFLRNLFRHDPDQRAAMDAEYDDTNRAGW